MKSPTIAVVRGPYPNVAEILNYAPLARVASVTAYVAGSSPAAVTAQLKARNAGAVAVRGYSLPALRFPGMAQKALMYRLGIGTRSRSACRDILRADIVVIADPIYAFFADIAERMRPEQKLVVVRWELIPTRYEQIRGNRERARRVFERADLIIATTRSSADSLCCAVPEAVDARVEVIPCGVSASEAHPLPDGEPAILCLSRLQWQKGIDDLVAAHAILRQRHGVRTRLRIAGSGDARRFRRLAGQLGVEDSVELLGSVAYSEVARLMASSTLYCQPSNVSQSWSEQFGFAAVEAMASARPVVACASGALQEVLGPDAYYAPTRNAAALAAVIKGALADRAELETRGLRLAARARAEFDLETQGRRLAEAVLSVGAQSTR